MIKTVLINSLIILAPVWSFKTVNPVKCHGNIMVAKGHGILTNFVLEFDLVCDFFPQP